MSRRQVTLMDVLLYELEQDERRIEEQAEMAQTSNPDAAIFFNLRQALHELKALEQSLEITAEYDAGEYLRKAADRAQDIRALVWPVYYGMLKERTQAEKASGEDGNK